MRCPLGASGSSPPAFFTSTINSWATWSASARESSRKISWSASAASTYGCSNRPSASLRRSTLPHGRIHQRLGHRARIHQRGQMLRVRVGDHVHVQPSQDAQARGIGEIGRDAVVDQLKHRLIVAQNHARPLPLVAQDRAQGQVVDRGRHAADLVERAHHAAGAGVEGGLEWRQVYLAQAALRQIDGVVIAAGLGCAVANVVFGAGGHAATTSEIAGLEAAHARTRQRRAQKDILAGALGDPAPARIARDIDHRRKDPVDPMRGCLFGGDARRALQQRRIPGTRLGQRDREHRSEAVNHIGADDQGDAQARLLDGDALVAIDQLRIGQVQQRSHLAGANLLIKAGRGCGSSLGGWPDIVRLLDDFRKLIGAGHLEGHNLHQLADLLGQGHLWQQRIHARFNRGIELIVTQLDRWA